MLLLKNNLKNALKAFNTAISINEKKPELYDERAEVYEKLADYYQRAIKDLTTSIEIYNKDGNIYYRRGMLYLKIKNSNSACEDFSMGKLLKNQKAIKALKVNCK